MPRPRGVYGGVRKALLEAAKALPEGATWRALAVRAGVGWTAARRAVENMVRAGELVRVGTVTPEGALRGMAAYVWRGYVSRQPSMGAELWQVLGAALR